MTDFHRPLGGSGLRVSRACLGTANFGTAWGLGVPEEQARPVIDAFLDAGHTLLDTADNYNAGESERIVGAAVRGRRDQVVIATKAFQPHGPGPNERGLSRVHLTRALEASLRRLGTDHVDLYQCHQWDEGTPIEETMATLDGFVRDGKVRYLGASNFTAAQIVEAQWAAQRVAGTPLVGLQAQYSLLRRDIEAEILPAARRHRLGVLAYGVLGGGVLAGRYRSGARPDPASRMGRVLARETDRARRWVDDQLSERNLAIAREVARLAGELGTTPTAVAVAWVAARPGVASVVLGPRTHEQYEQALPGFALDLPAGALERLAEVSGPAPVPVTGRLSLPWSAGSSRS
ncbi:aldo/keto reductase [Actinophytocola xinjiangensis]|uniref:Aldo/keto reductase n=1 Tax=Actinophytocola xinjiangensis TaxID=485602 RepID=A0A7Z1AV80_9PSEU|nr:aldo/keto reductase [Actinophytocola xinjiangensis]OLF05373.1 aldo/keto reductase [Actinophytocola xinjiangensis]